MQVNIIKEVAAVEDFLRLRIVSGLTPRPIEAAKKALPNSLFGVHLVVNASTVAMGRVVGDGALNFEIVDVAVDPNYQGKGLGRIVMQNIMHYLEQNAVEGAYITLLADVPELYKKFGFVLSRPECEGMHWEPGLKNNG
ncbi:GNAT family N-acetyltransferase [Colwellia sp. BRX10-3]|uniref:GNAT family N-acetyltransferase n=1 Tax=Colwellia sp. BRX10-3 TaxID=2759844 RepID=UPI0015F6A947|nr:GNAT family N-acetyltransferase [Colwellia sp. BRX10-3]MBA6391881.1 GNAT family N-acetyltransferase [Colwellia sp. BRX10-3]